VCAVDGSEASLGAVRQARVLRSEQGRLELAPSSNHSLASACLTEARRIISEAEKEAAADLAEAKSCCPEATAHLLHGTVIGRLLARITECDATLFAVRFDGSPAATRAVDAARRISERHGSALRVNLAGATCEVDSQLLDELGAERDEREPLEALLAAAGETDLRVVGSRGLRGIRSLGSVSERIGHQAACSVLVVR
jgi:nucleotide-binding universal stress UspA family protein